MKYDVIIYHNADPDGIFSAAIALAANPNAELVGYNYEPDFSHIDDKCINKNVVIVDISPNPWLYMHRLCGVAKNVLWIDHHTSAYKDCNEKGTEALFKNLKVVYDPEWGACMSVWKHFFPERRIPDWVIYIAGYDVWRDYGSPVWETRSMPFRLALQHLKCDPQGVCDLFQIASEKYESTSLCHGLLLKGQTIKEYVEAENEFVVNNPSLVHEVQMVANERLFKVLAINKSLHGDMFKGHDMSKFDFAVGYFHENNCWKISLRGCGKGFDLGAIANKHGGGGHKDAAGFRVKTFQDIPIIWERPQ